MHVRQNAGAWSYDFLEGSFMSLQVFPSMRIFQIKFIKAYRDIDDLMEYRDD